MSDAVQQIKDRLDILEVIAPYVELHKAGKSYKGKSPFTNEKTPSFYVSPDRGMYYCFSTNQGGDMFTFIQTMEGLDFKGALKLLADKAGVELTPISPEVQSKQDRLYAVLAEATTYFQRQLGEKPDALTYLEGRGLKPTTIAAWQIGFAPGPPQGWRLLRDHLKGRGYSDTELLSAGLIKPTDGTKEPYDVFRNRIMFPLFDASGRPVAFSGRTVETGTDIPKYVNSPETDLYKKSELLFGYDRARQNIRKLDFSLIVEGQFDVVLCHQAGYTNTVAVSGTALTPLHVRLLERLSKRVVLALDSDRAGIAAMKRAADLMLRRGFDVKVARLKGGKDPADLIAQDPSHFKKMIGEASPVIEFLIALLDETESDVRSRKLKAREEILPYVALIPNRIDQEHFEGLVATALGTSHDAVHFEIERLRQSADPVEVEHNDKVGNMLTKSNNTPLEVPMTVILRHAGELTEAEKSKLDILLKDISGDTTTSLLARLSVGEQAALALTGELAPLDNNTKARQADLVHALNLYRSLYLKQKLGELKEQLAVVESEGSGAVDSILSQIAVYQQKLRDRPVVVEDIFLTAVEDVADNK